LKGRASDFFKAILKKKDLTSWSYFSYYLLTGLKDHFSLKTLDADLLKAKPYT
jgi:hypothetical protein